MAVYNILLILLLGLGVPLCIYKPTRLKQGIYLAFILGYMWFLATFRTGFGYDYEVYIRMAGEIGALKTLPELMAYGYEPGYVLLTKLITLMSGSSTVMYGIYTAVIFIPIGIFIFRHCKDVWLSLWLYVTLAFFYANMNFVRQSIACAIIACGYDFLKKKEGISLHKTPVAFLLQQALPFVLITLLAGSFHKTALIMIPVFFLVQIPLNKITGAIYAGVVLLLFLFSEQILNFALNFVFTNYKGERFITEGLSLTFLIMPVMALIVCGSLYIVWKKRDQDAPMLFKMAIISSTFWLFCIRHMILERFSMYNYIFLLVAIPAALRSLQASPEVIAQRDELKIKVEKARNPQQQDIHKLDKLEQKIADHRQYYWAAVVAVVLLTFFYNSFGMNVNGFHKAFPYQSIIPGFPFSA